MIIEPKIRKPKRELIIEQAAALFKEKGFGGATMRDLAERVGMEAASIYNHLRSKDEILDEICFGLGRKYNEQLKQIDESIISFPAKIESIIAFHIQMIIENRNRVSVLNNDWRFLSNEKLIAFKKMRKEYEGHIANIISKGMEIGAFKKVNVSVALFTILSSLRWVELWYKPSRGVSKENLAKDISTILMNGINV